MKRLRDTLNQPISSFLRRLLQLAAMLVVLVLVYSIALVLYNLPGTGFGAYFDSDGKYVSSKTLWDWLGLLIVPVILAIGGYVLQRNERLRAEARSDEEQKQADNRAKVDREIADDRLREESLQTYLDRMSELMLEGHFKNPNTKENARAIARALTLITLNGLEGQRQHTLLRFLFEAHLINGDTATIDLSSVHVEKVNLMGNWDGVNLKGIFFDHVNLFSAHLKGAHLEGAVLTDVDLRRSHLEGVHLEGSYLQGVYFNGANLTKASFSQAHLVDAEFIGATVTLDQFAEARNIEKVILPDGSHYKPLASP